jgi:hypothetical protein
MIRYGDLDVSCPNCKTLAHYNHTILWANQHGMGIRIFCKVCSQWTDKKILYRTGVITIRVVHRPVS